MPSEPLQNRFGTTATALAIAWPGIFYHDLAEFGSPVIAGSIVVLVIAVLLFRSWWQLPRLRSLVAVLVLVFGLTGLFVAVTSMLPLGFWPWTPEQTLGHYLSYGVWVFAVLPLVWVSASCLWRQRSEV